MRLSSGILLPALIVLISSCASQPHALRETQETKQYQQSLEAFTREASLYHQLDTHLLVRVTLLTEPFQDAYWRQYARVYHLDAHQLAEYRGKDNVRFAEGINFMVQVASRAPRLAALEPEKSLWRLTLRDGEGLEASPVQVVRIKKPTADDHYFFPYTKDFGDTYLLRFPPYPGWTASDSSPQDRTDAAQAHEGVPQDGAPQAGEGTPVGNPVGEGDAPETKVIGASGGSTTPASPYSGPRFSESRRLLLEFAGTLGTVVLEWNQGGNTRVSANSER